MGGISPQCILLFDSLDNTLLIGSMKSRLSISYSLERVVMGEVSFGGIDVSDMLHDYSNVAILMLSTPSFANCIEHYR